MGPLVHVYDFFIRNNTEASAKKYRYSTERTSDSGLPATDGVFPLWPETYYPHETNHATAAAAAGGWDVTVRPLLLTKSRFTPSGGGGGGGHL